MGGKKKKSSNVSIKQESKYKIPKLFNCPLCDGKACLIIKMNKKEWMASVRCRICNKPDPEFKHPFCRLHKPVDVFYMYYEEVWRRDQEELKKRGIVTKSSFQPGAGRAEFDSERGLVTSRRGGEESGRPSHGQSMIIPESLLRTATRPVAGPVPTVEVAEHSIEDDEVAGFVGNQALNFEEEDEDD